MATEGINYTIVAHIYAFCLAFSGKKHCI